MESYIHGILTVLVTVSVSGGHGYHILYYQPIPSPSHDLLARGIVNPLLKAGHQITWVTPFPAGKPKNVTVVDVSQTIAILEALDLTNKKVSGFELAKSFIDSATEAAFSEDVRRALLENQYDAIISEWFFTDVAAGFAAVQKVPWILLSGFPLHPHLESLVDTTKSISTNPPLGYIYPTPMNFWNRVKNTFTHLSVAYNNWIHHRNEAAVYEAFFKPIAEARGVAFPPYATAIRDVAILLVNAHPSFAPAQSQPPNVVDIGGYHIEEQTPPLPKDLQEILDSSPEGVVYFSMGTIMKTAALPQQMNKDFIEVLGSIPYTVLWKFEDKLENLPSNVHVRAWMPQSSILAHPNIKVFISHCGLLSTLETLQYGVPMLALPVFGDQPNNADRAVWSGYAVKVTFKPDMKEEFKQGLNEILNNDRYYRKAKYISRLFRNRPVAPSTLIKHYVELAIETKGAYHLRSTNNLYEWYEIWMLDLVAILLVCLIIIYSCLTKISKSFRRKQMDVMKNKKCK